MMNTTHQPVLLLVEDDRSLGQQLRRGLKQEGYLVVLATTAAEARTAVQTEALDCILLDWGLPDESGMELLREWRSGGLRVPVLFLTARDEVGDRVDGLDAGADDYLTKPFAFEELLARVRTLLRRSGSAPAQEIVAGDLTIHLLTRKVLVRGEPLELTPREFDLLSFLAARKGDTVSRETINRELWGGGRRFTSLDNVIDVHMTNLRRKLREVLGHDPVQTVRGVGFRMSA